MDTEDEETYLNKIEYVIDDLSSISKRLGVSAYYNRVEHYPSGKYRTGGVNPRRIEAVSYITGAEIENQTLTDLALFTYGTDFYYRNWYGNLMHRYTGATLNGQLFPDTDVLDFGAYIKAERDFEKVSLTAGLRGDIFYTEAQEALTNSVALTDDNAQTDLYPSAFIFGKYFLDDNTNIFAGTGLTTRTPTVLERYTQQGVGFYGNPDLEPAHNFETDLGFETKLFEKLTFRAKGFYSYIDDYIYQASIPARTWTNIDAYMIGGDMNASFDVGHGFSIDGALAYQRGRKLDQPVGNNDKDLAEIAPLKIKGALNYDKKGLSAVFEWVHSEDYDDIDADGGETALDGWDVFNFRAGYQFAGQEGGLSILNGAAVHFGISNIFDKEYAVANSYEYDPTNPGGANVRIVNEPGRFIYGSLSYRF
jgi:iron complex outermembrane receptor protein